MRTTFSINFYCRRSKANKQGLAPVEMSIIINGKREFLHLPRKEKPVEFEKMLDSKKGNDLKSYLEEIRIQSNKAITEILESGVALTANKLKEYIQNGGYRKYTIEDLFTEYLEILKGRVGISLQKDVYNKYVLMRDRFFEMVDKDDSVNTITSGIVAKFYAELNKDMKQSTSAGYMTKLKTVVLYAIDNDRMKINPFNSIKITRPEENVDHLNENELKKIGQKRFSCERLERVKDLFLFQCYSGLAYADMADLVREDIQNSDNTTYIYKTRIKTGVTYTAVILPEGVKILEKYGYQLPMLSNQKYNSYLKEIGDFCGISKKMHTHLGRHTYASLCLNKGVRIEILSKMLGHTNIKQTQHYAKLMKSTIFDEVNRAFK